MQADWLAERLEVPVGALTVRQADLTRGIGRVLRATLATLIEAERIEECDPCADLFVRALVDGIREPGTPVAGQLGRGILIHAVKKLVSRRLGDADLTAAAAARELGCSLSKLHLHCQRAGSSFGTMLLEARLAAAAEALRLAPPAHGWVAFVAFACGFSDPSHFARKFKARFGVSPKLFS